MFPFFKYTLIVIVLSAVPAYGTSVEFTTADPINNIQDSIYFSSADSIFLRSGTYNIGDLGTSGIVLVDSVALFCIDGAGSCTLSALSSDSTDTCATVITCYFDDPISMTTILHGFVVTGANGDNGGGIMAYNGCPTIDSCTITGNHADSSGGGMLIVGTEAYIRNSKISDNSSYTGGGICAYGGQLHIENTEFSGNFGEMGGGFLISSADIDFENIDITHNSGQHGAGGLLTDVTGNIAGSYVFGNYATNAGGLMISGCMGMNFQINDCLIDSNFGYEGGGFFIDSSEILISECELTRNSGIGYGGVMFFYNSDLTVEYCYFHENDCAGDGAGIFMYRSAPLIRKCRMEHQNAHGYGGALYIYGNSNPVIRENLFFDNSVSYGACIYIEYQSSPVFVKNTVAYNSARMGGAISICEASKAYVDSCFFVDNGSLENEVSGFCSMVMNSDTIYVRHSNVYYNTYQPDVEISSACTLGLPFDNNFWWTNDSSEVRGMIEGRVLIDPIRSDFIPGVPGEPLNVYSISSLQSDFATPLPTVNPGDTVYLELQGEDRMPSIAEAAVVIISSAAAPGGIAVALAETDTCSGIYRGIVLVRTTTGAETLRIDDIRQIIRVEPRNDTIVVRSNMAPSVQCLVNSQNLAVAEAVQTPQDLAISAYPNPFNSSVRIVVDYRGVGRATVAPLRIEIFDIKGRLVYIRPPSVHPVREDWEYVSPHSNEGYSQERVGVVWKPAENVGSGVYFVRAIAGDRVLAKRIAYIK